MARADFYNRVRELLYGTALGEAPPIRLAAADSAESIAGRLVSITLATGQGAEVKAGHVLSHDVATASTTAHAIYVTSVAGEVVTGVNGYWGSPPVVAAASALDGAVLEQNPSVTSYLIHRKIEDIFATALWPFVFKNEDITVTPDLSTYQVEVPARVKDIDSAWQTIGGIKTRIPHRLILNAPGASTRAIGEFGFIDGSTTNVSVISRLVEGDEATVPELVALVSTGAAALLLGAASPETSRASASKDSQTRAEMDPARRMWQDFITLRSSMSEGLSRDRGTHFVVDRG